MSPRNLSELLNVRYIELDLKAKKKEEALAELLDLFEAEGAIKNSEEILEALLDRERLTSTGIGEGVAIPHVFVEGLTDTLIAFGRKRKGVAFNAIDRLPVHLIFLILGPEDRAEFHLQLLSKMARYLRDEELREALLNAKDPEEIIRVVEHREQEDVLSL